MSRSAKQQILHFPKVKRLAHEYPKSSSSADILKHTIDGAASKLSKNVTRHATKSNMTQRSNVLPEPNNSLQQSIANSPVSPALVGDTSGASQTLYQIVKRVVEKMESICTTTIVFVCYLLG